MSTAADYVRQYDRLFLSGRERKRNALFGVQLPTEIAINTTQGRGHLLMIHRHKE
jgi:hypothetical protein